MQIKYNIHKKHDYTNNQLRMHIYLQTKSYLHIKNIYTINKKLMHNYLQSKQNTNNYILICIIINLCIII